MERNAFQVGTKVEWRGKIRLGGEKRTYDQAKIQIAWAQNWETGLRGKVE